MSTDSNLCLQYRTNSAWKKARCWSGKNVNNATWYDDLSASFDATGSSLVARFRFTGNIKEDSVFIDKVLIRGRP